MPVAAPVIHLAASTIDPASSSVDLAALIANVAVSAVDCVRPWLPRLQPCRVLGRLHPDCGLASSATSNPAMTLRPLPPPTTGWGKKIRFVSMAWCEKRDEWTRVREVR
jgi:hypothetical protein